MKQWSAEWSGDRRNDRGSPGVGTALACACLLAGLVAAGCGGAPGRSPFEREDLAASAAPARRFYALRFEGALVGFASEEERVTDGRRQLVRREVVQMRRAEELASFEIELRLSGTNRDGATSIEAVVRHCVTGAASGRLPPVRAEFLDGRAAALTDTTCPAGQTAGPLATRATAEHAPSGWTLRDERGTRSLPAEAQPAEWLDVAIAPQELRARGGVEGPLPLFFATRQFATGRALRRYLSPTTWVGTVELEGAILESTIELDRDDRPRLIVDGSGVVAERVAETALAALLAEPLPLVDLVALTSLPIQNPTGQNPSGLVESGPQRLVVTLPRAAPLPPEAPGQRVAAADSPPRWLVELEPADPTFAPEELPTVATVAELARRVAEDESLGEGGDCTARALRFGALAAQAQLRVRVATGFIIDGPALVRHRWAIAWTGARWIAVDPSAPAGSEAPAAPVLVTLALHDATAEGLAAAEAAFVPWRGATVARAPQ